jgi:hypothetical protein
MHHRIPRAGGFTPLAAALIGTAALALPSGALAQDPAPADPHNPGIEITMNMSDVFLVEMDGVGGDPGDSISLERNGVVLATGTVGGISGEAGVNADHIGVDEGDPAAPVTGCWDDGFTPQMLPGDDVVVGDARFRLPDITAQAPTLEAGNVVVRGTVGPGADLSKLGATIHSPTAGGNADRFESDTAGGGGQFVDAPASVESDGVSWKATFSGLSDADKEKALRGDAVGSIADPEPDPATDEQLVTFAYHAGAEPGPVPACEGNPFRPNAVSAFGVSMVNAANAATPVAVSGLAQPGVSAVAVTLTDAAGATSTVNASLSGNQWTANVPVNGLADGTLVASARYTNADGSFAGANKSIVKDTVGPAAPTANLASGTYTGAVDLILSGENVRYTTDGSDPNAASTAYSRAIRVDATRTVKAVAFDAAGNASPVSQVDLTIAQPAITPILAPPTVAAPARLQLASLTVSRRAKLASVRKSGIRARLAAPRGAKAVRVRLRLGNKTIASVVRRVSGNRRMTVALPSTKKQRRALKLGLYTLQITPGSATNRLDGVTTLRRLRVIR